MKTLYVNGCSHTAGSECNTNYANIIGQKLNYKVINKATPGGGNHKIYRETMEYLCNDNHPVDFVIIGWTTHERFEFSFDGENTDYTLYKESYNKELEKFYRYADLHMADWDLGLQNTITYQLGLQTFLESKNIDYRYINMFNHIPEDCQIPIWKNINQSKYILPHSSFIETLLEQYPNMFSSTKHATDPVIHEKISEAIIKEM